MKAISIRQPWAWAILHAGKRLENRDWKGCSYRGPVLLHASKWWNAEEVADTFEGVRAAAGPGRMHFAPPVSLRSLRSETGGIVGRAVIDGVIRDERDFAAYCSGVLDGERQRLWWAGGFALALSCVEPLPFVPWRGMLGLFEVPDDYAERATP